jgi:type VI secretion system protein ImpH
MPPTQWRDVPGVIDRLLHAPQQFGFFQAVRLLDCWLRPDAQDSSGLARIRFRSSISLAFPASEIETLKVCLREQVVEAGEVANMAVVAAAPMQGIRCTQAAIDHIELTPAFMGILGVNGTMPLFYTEMLAQREHQYKDHSARAFMDIFGSRSVSLFYQAWRKHRLPMQYESDRRHGFMSMVLSLAGLGQGGLRDRLSGREGVVADESLAYYAGALQQRTLSGRQLQQVLQHHLGVAVRMDQFVGRWYALPSDARAYLGRMPLGRAPRQGVLGRSAMLGERVWQRDLRVRVVLGPLTHARFRQFLPGEPGALALKSLLTLLGGVSLEYEINLQLQKQDIQGCELNSQRAPISSRLGWDTFLQTRPATADRSDVRYDIHESI